MSDVAIRIEGLGKRYRIGVAARRPDTLRDAIAERVSAFWNRRHSNSIAPESNADLWALKDVTFNVQRGEILGVIGRNGAGKSTLLKILSRITEPTEGCAQIRGRVASLLEVGVGFHPELTARENIYVNGAILGMKRAEIRARFDEILAFAEVERFVDTPVKHLSSGMYVRLAFAVAAHLETEILIIDEVLAVGDAEFQKKCLGKIGDVTKNGRTVLFVSHNMAAVQKICTRGITLRNGSVEFAGTQTDAIEVYLRSISVGRATLADRADTNSTREVEIEAVEFVDRRGEHLSTAMSGQYLGVRLYFTKRTAGPCNRLLASVMFRTQLEVPVFLHHNRLSGQPFGPLPRTGFFEFAIPKLPLPPGTYRMGFNLILDTVCVHRVEDAVELNVIDGDFYGSGEVPPIAHGLCLVEGSWSLNPTAIQAPAN
jgi:lipopolysaccharide transport system ATP-binding protein